MRNDPFRTLDDPTPAAGELTAEAIAAAIAAGAIAAPDSIATPSPAAAVLLGWQAPLQRPGWLRRLVVWLVLGWRWDVTAE